MLIILNIRCGATMHPVNPVVSRRKLKAVCRCALYVVVLCMS